MSIRQFFFLLMVLLTAPRLLAQSPTPVSRQISTQVTAQLTEPALTLPTTQVALSLNQALAAARNNLDVALSRNALAASRADVLSADRAPFPSLITKFSQMDLQNGTGSGDFLTQQRVDKSIGLDWTWERGNKRQLRTRTAQNAAAAAAADLDEIRTQQQLATQAGFFDLLASQERVQQIATIERSAAQLASTAAKRVAAGDLAAQDAARTEIEAQRALSDLQVNELDRQRAAIALWQLTGVSTPPEQLQAQADWPTFAYEAMSESQLLARVAARADVKAAQARVLAAQAALDGSAAQKVSDITWGASYDHYPGVSNALLELRMQMPLQWGYRYQGEIARASAQLALAQDALEKTRRIASSELQRLRQEVMASATRAQRYEADILPRARRVADGAELAYNKGALSLTDLLDARRTLRATLIDALNTKADFAKAAGAWKLRTENLPSGEPAQ
jgi:outer membrane protein, heavy metal efflux system